MSPQRGGWWPDQCLYYILGALALTVGGIVMAVNWFGPNGRRGKATDNCDVPIQPGTP